MSMLLPEAATPCKPMMSLHDSVDLCSSTLSCYGSDVLSWPSLSQGRKSDSHESLHDSAGCHERLIKMSACPGPIRCHEIFRISCQACSGDKAPLALLLGVLQRVQRRDQPWPQGRFCAARGRLLAAARANCPHPRLQIHPRTKTPTPAASPATSCQLPKLQSFWLQLMRGGQGTPVISQI